ncbi:MAG: hypothetical protein JNM50_00705 [Chromatiales bacterium]|jgi:uncharacterized membrane protein|nr:hypothetical protein [Chromatiales bacterium]
MNGWLSPAGNVAGIAGAVLCAITGAGRLLGYYDVGGLGLITIFLAGIGLMVFACLLKLQLIASRLPSP